MSSSASDQFSSEDRVVIVMGPTGAGKSTFIEHATRQYGKYVGHSWRSEPPEIRSVRTTHSTGGHPVVFVDTPGLDHTTKSDMEIITVIADWLVKVYKSNVNLSAILYLHRMSDNRMSSTAMKNLRLFSTLCGRKAMPNVIIVTTMWDLVPAERATMLEKKLKQEVWNDMLGSGCGIKRFRGTYESAWDIVGDPLNKDSGAPYLSQEEMDDRMDDLMRSANEIKGTDAMPRLLNQIRGGLSRWFGWSSRSD